MTFSAKELKQILKTLPITYYAKCKLPIEIDEEAETSYFCPTTREIFISLNGVNQELKNVPTDGLNKEQIVRAHLYHELSHAILTPRTLEVTDIINIFEDERIETLLANYYMDTNFKESIKALCGFNPNSIPQNNWEKFFYAVRFRVGKKEWLEEIKYLIDKYTSLNWNTDNTEASRYYWDIRDLYTTITNDNNFDWEKAIEEYQQASGEGDIPSEYAMDNQGNATDNQDNANGTSVDKDGFGKDASNLISQAIQSMQGKEAYDEYLYQAVESILQNFAKKNKGGSAMSTYSGVFNPRSVARDDYRYFDRKATVNGANHFGSVHLNMFIDDSSSFRDNAEAANKIIATLCALERKYNFFTVDFALCGNMVKRVDHKHAKVVARNGTAIDAKATETVLSMQKKDSLTYNIVLYDGSANYCRSTSKYAYRPFDMTNATLILDTSCLPDAKKCKKAKVIISRNYISELQSNIIKTLQRAFQ